MTPTTMTDLVRGNIRGLREQRNWSQGDLAARMRANGLTRWTANMVAKIETGKLRADRVLDLATLCAAFGVSLTELLAGNCDVIMDDPGNVRPLLGVRMALVGLAEPTDPDLIIVEEYNLDRIAVRAGLEHEGDLRMVTYALYGRQNFLELRDERAGIAIRPGSRANIQARRGNATKALLGEIAVAVEQFGLQTLLDQAMAKYEAAAIDINDDRDAT